MDSKKSNKIRDIVRLQQILKKWRKVANASKNNSISSTSTTTSAAASTTNNGGGSGGGNKGMKFLKKTLSFSDNSVSSVSTTEYVPKGYLAVCVGKELKRYVIPTDYLGHQAFGILLREAEEEFGFHQEGVLKIPCEVAIFEKILKMVQHNKEEFYFHELGSFEFHASDIDVMSSNLSGCCSPDCEQLLQPSIPQLCR
ncbi:hypothetical protein BVRB_7g177800 [Beta vulgaris subsp. vulgaris]|uniref:Uncharacterized protein n=1 Tax=Beta vulgaris subsp. vulgaris TaxID=3555 RepID=A0A0J8BB19_BETVV|nr:uncharacterized protein LOC104908675 [Beta vulgaris subsp. vulgaris]KMS97198.1 hypothetical protein BVRB_7g177800 [Beta vulgaris subsp. vulgaris]